MTFRRETNVGWTYVERSRGPFLQKKVVRYYRFLISDAVICGNDHNHVLEWEASDWHAAMERQWQEPLRIVPHK